MKLKYRKEGYKKSGATQKRALQISKRFKPLRKGGAGKRGKADTLGHGSFQGDRMGDQARGKGK